MKETNKASIIKPDDPRWADIVKSIGLTDRGLPVNVLRKLLSLVELSNETQPTEKEVNGDG